MGEGVIVALGWFSFLNKAQCFLEFGELIGIGGSLNWGIWGF